MLGLLGVTFFNLFTLCCFTQLGSLAVGSMHTKTLVSCPFDPYDSDIDSQDGNVTQILKIRRMTNEPSISLSASSLTASSLLSLGSGAGDEVGDRVADVAVPGNVSG